MWIAGILLVLGIAVGSAVLMHRERQRRYRDALAASCLLCDSHDVEVLDADERYHCRACGFDSGAEGDPALAPLLAQFRDVKYALQSLRRGAELTRKAELFAGADVAFSSGQTKYERLDQANQELRAGYSLLRDVLAANPHLLELPRAGGIIDQATRARDLLLDGIGTDLAVLEKIFNSRQEIDAYIVQVADLEAAIASRVRSRQG